MDTPLVAKLLGGKQVASGVGPIEGVDIDDPPSKKKDKKNKPAQRLVTVKGGKIDSTKISTADPKILEPGEDEAQAEKVKKLAKAKCKEK